MQIILFYPNVQIVEGLLAWWGWCNEKPLHKTLAPLNHLVSNKYSYIDNNINLYRSDAIETHHVLIVYTPKSPVHTMKPDQKRNEPVFSSQPNSKLSQILMSCFISNKCLVTIQYLAYTTIHQQLLNRLMTM